MREPAHGFAQHFHLVMEVVACPANHHVQRHAEAFQRGQAPVHRFRYEAVHFPARRLQTHSGLSKAFFARPCEQGGWHRHAEDEKSGRDERLLANLASTTRKEQSVMNAEADSATASSG